MGAAIIGLIGVVIGAGVTTATTYLLALRKETTEAISAAVVAVANDLDPVERRMVIAAVTRALQQVFAS